MEKKDYIGEIASLMEEKGACDVSWLYCRNNRPSIIRDGVKYEIYAVALDEDGGVTLETLAVNPWMGPKDLRLDETWRSRTLAKILDLVRERLSWRF